MADTTARQQRGEERRRDILDAARQRAEAEGWAGVTTRHLADAIGYTQPVLYGHFPGGKTEIMRVLALEGFVELTLACRSAAEGCRGRAAVEAVAVAYLDFATAHPAIYEAMFRQPIDTRFADVDVDVELRQGFDALASALGDEGDGTVTEVFWGALHGMGELERAGRMRPEHRGGRITELGARFARERD